jgi:hypothetical protein
MSGADVDPFMLDLAFSELASVHPLGRSRRDRADGPRVAPHFR